jgi:hypothetical protein
MKLLILEIECAISNNESVQKLLKHIINVYYGWDYKDLNKSKHLQITHISLQSQIVTNNKILYK